jgi:hypothetical protein
MATPRIKTHFGLQHLLAASLFARKALEVELAHEGEIVGSGEPYHSHRAYVTGAALSAVASLEATINDLFIEATHRCPNLYEKYDPRVAKSLKDFWSDDVESLPTLCKYQVALQVANKELFAKGLAPYQDVDSLVEVRDALVHYKPEWDTDLIKHKKIEPRLKSRFELNPFTIPTDAFFPKKCLGHGFAEWGVQRSLVFMNEFFRRMGLSTIPGEARQDRDEIRELLRTR